MDNIQRINTDAISTNTSSVLLTTGSLSMGLEQYIKSAYNPLKSAASRSILDSSNKANKLYALDSWLANNPANFVRSRSETLILHDLQQTQFAHPEQYCLIPFVDKLAFTIDLTEEQLEDLKEAILSSISNTEINIVGRGPASVLPNNKEHYKYHIRFTVGDNQSQIILYSGLSETTQQVRPHQRLCKIVLNPARFSSLQLALFFQLMKSCGAFDYAKVMAEANVTTIDTALDLVGYPPCLLLWDKPKVEIIDIWHNQADGQVELGTAILGATDGSHSKAYNKTTQLLLKANYPFTLLKGFNGNDINITRFERHYKTNGGKAIIIDTLEKTPYILSDTQFYSPTLLRELNKKQRKFVRQYGFVYWLHVIAKEQTRQAVLELMPLYQLHVNHQPLMRSQIQVLEQLKGIILTPCNYL
ncbi:hypothetical protein GCM10011369_05950 [Neiella marina]|uniref:Uncharacterized protein n=2 Tax=Neiella marina TaxID=508461 RepID=A0A8J2U2M5_9GAMM|nr:hypothetical protein [Neiella marina]GGA67128.1 hypothetical protein GCM10011369_05950 [Neiella marina]